MEANKSRGFGSAHIVMMVVLVLVSIAAAVVLSAGGDPVSSVAIQAVTASDDPVEQGAAVFTTVGCAGCHTLESIGADGDIGPDLSHIGGRVDEVYLYQSIVDPLAVTAQGCPEGPCQPDEMPEYANILNEAQIEALVAFLAAQQ